MHDVWHRSIIECMSKKSITFIEIHPASNIRQRSISALALLHLSAYFLLINFAIYYNKRVDYSFFSRFSVVARSGEYASRWRFDANPRGAPVEESQCVRSGHEGATRHVRPTFIQAAERSHRRRRQGSAVRQVGMIVVYSSSSQSIFA